MPVLRWKPRISSNPERPLTQSSSTITSNQLPPEIWVNVASFLRSDDLWELRGLNSTFLTCAMKSRYGVVNVQPDYHASPFLEYYLKRLRDPYVHQLAHTLVVSSGAQYRFRYWNRHLYPWLTIPARPKPRQPRSLLVSHALNRDIPATLHRLGSLHHLVVKYEGTSSHYMHCVWRTCTSNVTHLTLQIALTLPALSHIMHIDPSTRLSRLHSANVEFRPQIPLPQNKRDRYTIASRKIITLLPETLEELALAGCMDQGWPILEAHNFPLLRVLRCEEFLKLPNPNPSQTSVIAKFVSAHSPTLELLHLKGNGLHILDLELSGGIKELLVDQDAIRSMQWHSFLAAIERGVATNLRRIDLGRCPYYRRGFDQRKDDLLAGLHQLKGIQELVIQVDELNPEILARLTLSLPLDGLQILEVIVLDRIVEGLPSMFELTSKFPLALPLEWPRWKVRFRGIGKALLNVDLEGLAPHGLLNERHIWHCTVQAYIRCLE